MDVVVQAVLLMLFLVCIVKVESSVVDSVQQ